MNTLQLRKFGLMMLMIFMSAGLLSAQDNNPEKKEKMFREVREFKMKYLAQEMELSEVQKKKFFELYEEMSDSRRKCYHDAVKMDRELKKDPQASEAEYQKVTDAFAQANAEWAVEEKQYNEKLAEFLTQKQIYKMREAERNYQERVAEMKHSRRKDHSGRPLPTARPPKEDK